MKKWLKQFCCFHVFHYEDLKMTGIPKPAEPTSRDYKSWYDYLTNLEKSDWFTKRVNWTCSKCGKEFFAHCGLDIMSKGKVGWKNNRPDWHA